MRFCIYFDSSDLIAGNFLVFLKMTNHSTAEKTESETSPHAFRFDLLQIEQSSLECDLAEKLKMCEHYPDLIPVDLTKESLSERVMDDTNGWGVDRFFECSGAVKAYESIFSCCSPGAHVVLIGNNAEPVPMNWAILFAKGLEYQTVHRYSHQYEPSIRLLGSGKIDVKPMITHTFKFDESVEAFERAAEHRPTDVKLQIKIDEEN